jgi:EAL and modified HD-GYP domain-containing signal transduction protein
MASEARERFRWAIIRPHDPALNGILHPAAVTTTMSLGKFVKRMFGTAPVAISDDPFGSKADPIAETLAGKAPAAKEPELLVRREEMLDGRSRIGGYRFEVQSMAAGTGVSAPRAIAALLGEGVSRLAQRRLALIPLTVAEWNSYDFRQFVAPHTVFVFDPVLLEGPAALQSALAAARAAGAKTGLKGMPNDPAGRELLKLTDLLLLHFRDYPLQEFEALMRHLRAAYPHTAVAVSGIQSWAEQRLCLAAGVAWCLGDFAAAPDQVEQGEGIGQSRLVLLEMLNLLRKEADLADLAVVAKRDPAVTMQVIAMANSPLSGLSGQVSGLDQAMMVLGRESLYRWLSVSLFRAGDGRERDEGLLEIALTRARFLELTATGKSKHECDELFLVGLFSLLDSLLGLPMAQVLAKVHLPPAVAEVLLNSGGPHGKALMLAMAVERGQAERAASLAAALGQDAALLTVHAAAARTWASEALQSM